MAIKHCGVTTTVWVFLFPVKRLLEQSVFSTTTPRTEMGFWLPCPLSLLLAALPHPILDDSLLSGSKRPQLRAAMLVFLGKTGGDLRLSASQPESRLCLSVSVLVETGQPGMHRGCGEITHPEWTPNHPPTPSLDAEP